MISAQSTKLTGKKRAESLRGIARRHALVKAATKEFFDKGYDRANLRSIIRASGASIDTLYRKFGNKEGLFLAVVTEHVQQVVGQVGKSLDINNDSIEMELYKFGLNYISGVLTPEGRAFFRMMISESARFPHISQMIMDLGPNAVANVLTVYLNRKAEEGMLRKVDMNLAAHQFLEIVKARIHYSFTTPQPNWTEIEKSVKSGVDLFYSGIRLRTY